MPEVIRFVGPTILIFLAVPLAFLAVGTSCLAFLILFFRAALVQVELCLAFVSSWLSFSSPHTAVIIPKIQVPAALNQSSSRYARRVQATAPFTASLDGRFPAQQGYFDAIAGLGTPLRDYEGVGGWRVPLDSQDDAAWLNQHSRLEMPISGSQGNSRQQRSLSSQTLRLPRRDAHGMRLHTSETPSPGITRETRQSPTGYFDLKVTEFLRKENAENNAQGSSDMRRQSSRSSSVGSTGSTQGLYLELSNSNRAR